MHNKENEYSKNISEYKSNKNIYNYEKKINFIINNNNSDKNGLYNINNKYCSKSYYINGTLNNNNIICNKNFSDKAEYEIFEDKYGENNSNINFECKSKHNTYNYKIKNAISYKGNEKGTVKIKENYNYTKKFNSNNKSKEYLFYCNQHEIETNNHVLKNNLYSNNNNVPTKEYNKDLLKAYNKNNIDEDNKNNIIYLNTLGLSNHTYSYINLKNAKNSNANNNDKSEKHHSNNVKFFEGFEFLNSQKNIFLKKETNNNYNGTGSNISNNSYNNNSNYNNDSKYNNNNNISTNNNDNSNNDSIFSGKAYNAENKISSDNNRLTPLNINRNILIDCLLEIKEKLDSIKKEKKGYKKDEKYIHHLKNFERIKNFYSTISINKKQDKITNNKSFDNGNKKVQEIDINKKEEKKIPYVDLFEERNNNAEQLEKKIKQEEKNDYFKKKQNEEKIICKKEIENNIVIKNHLIENERYNMDKEKKYLNFDEEKKLMKKYEQSEKKISYRQPDNLKLYKKFQNSKSDSSKNSEIKNHKCVKLDFFCNSKENENKQFSKRLYMGNSIYDEIGLNLKEQGKEDNMQKSIASNTKRIMNYDDHKISEFNDFYFSKNKICMACNHKISDNYNSSNNTMEEHLIRLNNEENKRNSRIKKEDSRDIIDNEKRVCKNICIDNFNLHMLSDIELNYNKIPSDKINSGGIYNQDNSTTNYKENCFGNENVVYDEKKKIFRTKENTNIKIYKRSLEKERMLNFPLIHLGENDVIVKRIKLYYPLKNENVFTNISKIIFMTNTNICSLYISDFSLISYDDIQIHSYLSKGGFGVVYKGFLMKKVKKCEFLLNEKEENQRGNEQEIKDEKEEKQIHKEENNCESEDEYEYEGEDEYEDEDEEEYEEEDEYDDEYDEEEHNEKEEQDEVKKYHHDNEKEEKGKDKEKEKEKGLHKNKDGEENMKRLSDIFYKECIEENEFFSVINNEDNNILEKNTSEKITCHNDYNSIKKEENNINNDKHKLNKSNKKLCYIRNKLIENFFDALNNQTNHNDSNKKSENGKEKSDYKLSTDNKEKYIIENFIKNLNEYKTNNKSVQNHMEIFNREIEQVILENNNNNNNHNSDSIFNDVQNVNLLNKTMEKHDKTIYMNDNDDTGVHNEKEKKKDRSSKKETKKNDCIHVHEIRKLKKKMLKYIHSHKKNEKINIDRNEFFNEAEKVICKLKSINKDIDKKYYENLIGYLLLDIYHNNVVYKNNLSFLYVNSKSIITFGLHKEGLYIFDKKNIFHYYSDKCIFKIIFMDEHKELVKFKNFTVYNVLNNDKIINNSSILKYEINKHKKGLNKLVIIPFSKLSINHLLNALIFSFLKFIFNLRRKYYKQSKHCPCSIDGNNIINNIVIDNNVIYNKCNNKNVNNDNNLNKESDSILLYEKIDNLDNFLHCEYENLELSNKTSKNEKKILFKKNEIESNIKENGVDKYEKRSKINSNNCVITSTLLNTNNTDESKTTMLLNASKNKNISKEYINEKEYQYIPKFNEKEQRDREPSTKTELKKKKKKEKEKGNEKDKEKEKERENERKEIDVNKEELVYMKIPVAIKIHDLKDSKNLKNFLREIEIYKNIQYQNICKFYGVCIKSDKLMLLLEYYPKGNLFNFLKNKKKIYKKQRLKWATELSYIVHQLHSHNPPIINGDIKTSNILIDDNMNLVMCDFGKARFKNSKLYSNFGSYRYMAPETFSCTIEITEKIDIWSLACCIVEIFTSKYPFYNFSKNVKIRHELLVNKRTPHIPNFLPISIKQNLEKSFSFIPEERPKAYEIYKSLKKIKVVE